MGRLAGGAAWMVLFRFVDRAIGIASTLFLARLLVPADFGVVAMAMSVISFIELATSFSFEIALIQKPDPLREHYDTAWTLNILVAIAGGLVTTLLSAQAARFYDEPRLTPVMLAIAVGWAVSGFENIGTVEFRRAMNFRREFLFFSYKRLVSFLVTIAAALMFRSYWALVIGMVSGRVAGVALSFLMQKFRPRLSLKATRELLSFSGWMVANNLAGVALGKVPHFFVGRTLGSHALGVYALGSDIANLMHTELVAPINRALFPGYSRLAGTPDQFRRTCLDATAIILLMVLPASVGAAVLAKPIVKVLLGDQWTDSVEIIQILALSGAVTAVLSNNASAYLALGLPRLVTLILASRLASLLAALVVLSHFYGLVGIAAAEAVAAVVCTCVSYPLLFWQLRLSAAEFSRTVWRPIVASAVMAATVYASNQPIAGDGFTDAIRQILLGVPLGVAVYLSMLYILWGLSGRPESAERIVAQRATDAFRQLRSRYF